MIIRLCNLIVTVGDIRSCPIFQINCLLYQMSHITYRYNIFYFRRCLVVKAEYYFVTYVSSRTYFLTSVSDSSYILVSFYCYGDKCVNTVIRYLIALWVCESILSPPLLSRVLLCVAMFYTNYKVLPLAFLPFRYGTFLFLLLFLCTILYIVFLFCRKHGCSTLPVKYCLYRLLPLIFSCLYIC